MSSPQLVHSAIPNIMVAARIERKAITCAANRALILSENCVTKDHRRVKNIFRMKYPKRRELNIFSNLRNYLLQKMVTIAAVVASAEL